MCLKTVHTHSKIVVFAANLAIHTGIAKHTPEPVVQPVVQVVGPGVGIPLIPPLKQDLPVIRFSIAIGIFQKECLGGLMHHYPAIGKLKRSRNIKAVSKYSKLVCPAIPIGIFQNHNTILAAAIRPEIPWIRYSIHSIPQTPPRSIQLIENG